MLTFAIACIGMTQIIVYGSIFNSVRPTKGWLGKLFSCPMCTGFWTGIILWALSPLTELFIFDHSLVTAFILGCYSSAVCYFASSVVDDYGINIRHSFEE